MSIISVPHIRKYLAWAAGYKRSTGREVFTIEQYIDFADTLYPNPPRGMSAAAQRPAGYLTGSQAWAEYSEQVMQATFDNQRKLTHEEVNHIISQIPDAANFAKCGPGHLLLRPEIFILVPAVYVDLDGELYVEHYTGNIAEKMNRNTSTLVAKYDSIRKIMIVVTMADPTEVKATYAARYNTVPSSFTHGVVPKYSKPVEFWTRYTADWILQTAYREIAARKVPTQHDVLAAIDLSFKWHDPEFDRFLSGLEAYPRWLCGEATAKLEVLIASVRTDDLIYDDRFLECWMPTQEILMSNDPERDWTCARSEVGKRFKRALTQFIAIGGINAYHDELRRVMDQFAARWPSKPVSPLFSAVLQAFETPNGWYTTYINTNGERKYEHRELPGRIERIPGWLHQRQVNKPEWRAVPDGDRPKSFTTLAAAEKYMAKYYGGQS